jgi:AcrR family transcriptional regulator
MEGKRARRPRGRPRNAKLAGRIVAATLRLISERGLSGTAMDEVAARSGVSKATIYQRWPSKDALCIDAIRHLQLKLPELKSADPRNDCITLLRDAIDMDNNHATERILARTIAELPDHPDLAPILRARIVEPRRELCTQILERAIQKRQLSPRTDLSLAVDLLTSPIFFRRLISTNGALKTVLPAKLVDAVWRAFAA